MLRPLAPADIEPLADVMARTFDDDPPWRWAHPRARPRRRFVRQVYRGRLRTLWREGMSLTTEDRAGVVLWAPPDGWHVPPGEVARALPAAVGLRMVPLAVGMRRVDRLHPDRPHAYLAVLGVDPERQGRGLGTALLEPGLERCDRERMSAFLETGKERNVPFYERHGFRVLDAVPIPLGGPTVWTMWRDPR